VWARGTASSAVLTLAVALVATPWSGGTGQGRQGAPTPTPGPSKGTLADAGSLIQLDATATPSPAGPRIVIDNATVKAIAGETELTTSSPSATPGSGQWDPVRSVDQRKDRRTKWRQRYADHLRLILATRERLDALDLALPDLWLEFYAEDDPDRREALVRKRLDSALEERDDLDRRLAEAESTLDDIVNQAWADGAEPGWFRDLQHLLRPAVD